MDIDKIKNGIERTFAKVRGMPMTQNQYNDLLSYFHQTIEPWKTCFVEKCPTEPDPRQKGFQSIVDAIKPTLDRARFIEMSCYPASYVNVGWLRDTTKSLIDKGEIQSTGDVILFITSVVQRVKQISVIKEDRADPYYHIDFMTKDDYGRYHYGYHLAIEKDLKDEKPSSVDL